jgi:glutathione S-transferase
MKLIIARPSPYARKVHVALIEKRIDFQTVVDNPWVAQTHVPDANPLGKVPALILDDGTVVHDSSVIIEYLETLGAPPDLIPPAPALRVAHKQIEAIADGICDAVALIALEGTRPPNMQSTDWIERQRRKIVAATRELSRLLGDQEWFTAAGFGLAEVATGCALEYIDFRYPVYDWRADAENLVGLFARLSARESFTQTKPAPQVLPQLH